METQVFRAEQIIKEIFEVETELPFHLCDVEIQDDFNLKHRTIKRPICINRCVFHGAVDVRYSEFQQVVDFSGCHFKEEVNSGDTVESLTVYKKDLIFKECEFDSSVLFNGIICEGCGYFHAVRFNEKVDFGHSNFKRSLECQKAHFLGQSSFNSLKANTLILEKAVFDKPANFIEVHLDGYFSASAVEFKSKVNFNGLQCGAHLDISNATFKSDEPVIFWYVSCAGNFCCLGAIFNGEADFFSLKCQNRGQFGGDFEDQNGDLKRSTVFKQAVDLTYAYFDSLILNRVTFEKGIKLKFSRVENLYCRGAEFNGECNFFNFRCQNFAYFGLEDKKESDALKKQTLFKEKVDLSYAYFGSLVLKRVTFDRQVDFTSIHIEHDLNLQEATFNDDVILYGATIEKMIFQETNSNCNQDFEKSEKIFNHPFNGDKCNRGEFFIDLIVYSKYIERNRFLNFLSKFLFLFLQKSHPECSSGLDLRRVNIHSFHAPEDILPDYLETFLTSQKTGFFSRDPYIQVEHFYRIQDNESAANKIYFEGMCALRGEALGSNLPKNKTNRGTSKKNNSIHWSKTKKIRNWLLKVLTGYGVQTWRLYVLTIVLVGLGMGVFWDDSALQQKAQQQNTSNSITSVAKPQSYLEIFFHRLAYSFDLFLPVDLQITSNLQPVGLHRELYAAFQIGTGWLIVPLLIASLTGILKKAK